MSRKIISLIVGIVIFILIMCASYIQGSNESVGSSTNKSNEVIDVVYKGKFPIPIENFIKVTSGFGNREASGVVTAHHYGIDLVGTKDSKIMSVKEGQVSFAGVQNGYGYCVEIKHINEDGNVFYTFYAHMKDGSIQVAENQIVMVGQVIGIQGSSGNSTGDHLHFEIRIENKEKVDPAPYLFNES